MTQQLQNRNTHPAAGPNRRQWLGLSALWLLGGGTAATAASAAPALMLAKTYQPGIDLADYWVSEKYDGLRGYWDGQRLWTRGGQAVTPPAWFTAGWPTVAMDGELWAGYGQFTKAVSTARQLSAGDAAWRGMRFMVFDLPASPGPFNDRLQALIALLPADQSAWLKLVSQRRVAHEAALRERLEQTVTAGGEGLMLHRGASVYVAERNGDLLKLKPHEDAEARVIAHVPGQGRLAGRLGALLVQMPDGVGHTRLRFKLGTGLSDAERTNPPPVGSVVTYRYRGLNDSGLPRFASFLRRRPDLEDSALR